jgi:hypothetical protein
MCDGGPGTAVHCVNVRHSRMGRDKFEYCDVHAALSLVRLGISVGRSRLHHDVRVIYITVINSCEHRTHVKLPSRTRKQNSSPSSDREVTGAMVMGGVCVLILAYCYPVILSQLYRCFQSISNSSPSPCAFLPSGRSLVAQVTALSQCIALQAEPNTLHHDYNPK